MKDFATSFQSLTNLTKVSSRVSAPPRNIDLIPFCLAPPPPPQKKLINLKLSDPLLMSTPTPILLPLKILENLTYSTQKCDDSVTRCFPFCKREFPQKSNIVLTYCMGNFQEVFYYVISICKFKSDECFLFMRSF